MRLILLLLCVLLNMKAQAISSFAQHSFITISGGLGWNQPGKSQELYLQEGFNNFYKNLSNQQQLGFGELFLGLENLFLNQFNAGLGFIISGAGMPKIDGEIWQFSDPEFNNITYSYKLNQLRLGLRGKLSATKSLFFSQFQPFLTGSIALAWNHSFSYHNFPLIVEAVAPSPFKDNTLTRFSYSLGLGIEKTLGEHFRAGVSYEFFDWGASCLGMADGQTTHARLGMNHLYVNSLLFSLSYHF